MLHNRHTPRTGAPRVIPSRTRRLTAALLLTVLTGGVLAGSLPAQASAHPSPTTTRNRPVVAAPETAAANTFTGMKGRVVRTTNKSIVVSFFPSGKVSGLGEAVYGAEVKLTLGKTSIVTTSGGVPRQFLSVYRRGDVVTVTGHVDTTRTGGGCILLNCSGPTTRYIYVIDAISSDGGSCVTGRSTRVNVPRRRDVKTRAVVCFEGTSGFASLENWDALVAASLDLTVHGKTYSLDLRSGDIAAFTLDKPAVRRTRITGKLTYDVLDDGRDAYTASIGAPRL